MNDEPPLIRTEMETGPARVTRTATAFVTRFQCQIVVDADQLFTLMHFWDRPANAGANWFEMPNDSLGQVEYHRVRFLGDGIARTLIRAGLYRATFGVETEDRVPVYS